MLVDYFRWVDEQGLSESVEVLRDWILRETEYRTVACETKYGLNGDMNGELYNCEDTNACVLCKDRHDIWSCERFTTLSVSQRWEVATVQRLCYRCLQGNHIGQQCGQTNTCNIGNCQQTHHPMLHSFTYEGR